MRPLAAIDELRLGKTLAVRIVQMISKLEEENRP